jgi:predicted DNA-binding ribbon-helix-helix protein
MWTALNDVAEREGCTVYDLVGRIDRRKETGQSFTSAIRVFLMLYYRNAARRADQEERAGMEATSMLVRREPL